MPKGKKELMGQRLVDPQNEKSLKLCQKGESNENNF